MSDPKDFVAGVDSDQRRSPTRVVFVTRRSSAQVKVTQEDEVQTFPEVLFRAALAIELLAIALVLFSLFFNAPLEGIAGRCRSAGSHAAHYRPDCHPLFQYQHRSLRAVSEGPRKTSAPVLSRNRGNADFSVAVPCIRRSRAHRTHCYWHDRCREQHARLSFAVAPLPCLEASRLLDHDVVSL